MIGRLITWIWARAFGPLVWLEYTSTGPVQVKPVTPLRGAGGAR